MMQSVARASARASSSCRIVVVSRRQPPARALCDTAISSAAGRSLPLASGTLARRRDFSTALALDGEETGGEQTRQAAADTDAKPRPRRRLLRERPAPITLTDRAATHLTQLLVSKPDKVGVRLGVKRRGCNGMSYTLKYADEKPKGDEEVVVQAVPAEGAVSGDTDQQTAAQNGARGGADAGGVKLFVDPMATLYIAGTVMDWEETELSSEFTFRNPNAKGECGCGESFNV